MAGSGYSQHELERLRQKLQPSSPLQARGPASSQPKGSPSSPIRIRVRANAPPAPSPRASPSAASFSFSLRISVEDPPQGSPRAALPQGSPRAALPPAPKSALSPTVTRGSGSTGHLSAAAGGEFGVRLEPFSLPAAQPRLPHRGGWSGA